MKLIPKLIPDWKDAWRWFSTWALTLLGALPPVWAALPADAKAYLPEGWGPYVLAVLAVCGLVGRLVDQK